MSFLKRLFGGDRKPTYVDKTGIYLYARCDHCGTIVRVRADKQHDLNQEDGGFRWHKTIVDSKCFRRMQAVVRFDGNYQVTGYDLQGGEMVDEAAYEAFLVAQTPEQPPDEDKQA